MNQQYTDRIHIMPGSPIESSLRKFIECLKNIVVTRLQQLQVFFEEGLHGSPSLSWGYMSNNVKSMIHYSTLPSVTKARICWLFCPTWIWRHLIILFAPI